MSWPGEVRGGGVGERPKQKHQHKLGHLHMCDDCRDLAWCGRLLRVRT